MTKKLEYKIMRKIAKCREMADQCEAIRQKMREQNVEKLRLRLLTQMWKSGEFKRLTWVLAYVSHGAERFELVAEHNIEALKAYCSYVILEEDAQKVYLNGYDDGKLMITLENFRVQQLAKFIKSYKLTVDLNPLGDEIRNLDNRHAMLAHIIDTLEPKEEARNDQQE